MTQNEYHVLLRPESILLLCRFGIYKLTKNRVHFLSYLVFVNITNCFIFSFCCLLREFIEFLRIIWQGNATFSLNRSSYLMATFAVLAGISAALAGVFGKCAFDGDVSNEMAQNLVFWIGIQHEAVICFKFHSLNLCFHKNEGCFSFYQDILFCAFVARKRTHVELVHKSYEPFEFGFSNSHQQFN